MLFTFLGSLECLKMFLVSRSNFSQESYAPPPLKEVKLEIENMTPEEFKRYGFTDKISFGQMTCLDAERANAKPTQAIGKGCKWSRPKLAVVKVPGEPVVKPGDSGTRPGWLRTGLRSGRPNQYKSLCCVSLSFYLVAQFTPPLVHPLLSHTSKVQSASISPSH